MCDKGYGSDVLEGQVAALPSNIKTNQASPGNFTEQSFVHSSCAGGIALVKNAIFIQSWHLDWQVTYRRIKLPTVENHMMARLPRKDRLCLLAVCEPINLHSAEVLCEPGQSVPYVYFPLNSTISLQALVEGSPGVEVGMVGREGMLGSQVALGVTTAPMHAHVQAAGPAYRIKTSNFCKELTRSLALRSSMNHYLYMRMVQMTTSAACLRFHPIGQRLARWLLMSQDRAAADSFHVTHELLAYMLGTRREGITAAAGALQSLGLIEYTRGYLTVLDRKGLEAAACGCYAVDQGTYANLM